MASKYNIRVQYAAWVAVVTTGVVLVLTVVHLRRLAHDQEQALRLFAQQEAKSVARAIAAPVARGDTKELVLAAAEAVGTDVLHLRVLNARGEELFRSPQVRDASELLMVAEPVLTAGQEVGKVELGMGRGRVEQRLWSAVLWDLGLGGLLLLVFVGGSVWVARPVANSLRNLLEYVREVAKGQPREEPLDTDLEEVDAVARELKTLMQHVEEARQRMDRAQKALQAAQKEMDEYTYVISHDLKEPLRGMEAFSKFLADGYRDKLDEEGRHHIDVIRKSVLRMQRLIEDLLKFSRLSQQKQPMQLVGMNTVLLHVRVRLQHALDAKRADLRVDKLPSVVCDETAMTEVFHNLISNAIKYNDKPLPVIEVGCSETINPDTSQPEYEFFVRDNGIGIKKEYFDKIFQIFQRLHHGEEGTGIGLTIVRRVIEWHGGRVWLESEEGKGTTFYFTLPKRDVPKSSTTFYTTSLSEKGTLRIETPV